MRNSGSNALSWRETKSGAGLPWLFSGYWTIGPHVEGTSIRGTKWRLYYNGQLVGGDHKTLSDAIRAANHADRSMNEARSRLAAKTIPSTAVREYVDNPISVPISDQELRSIANGRPYAIVEHVGSKKPFEAYCGVRDRDEVGRFATYREAVNALKRHLSSERNPGGTLPAMLDRCVAHVAPKLKRRGPRGSLSGAIAICTASAQKRGVLKKGTRTLTAKGKREERSAVRRAGYAEDTRAVGAMARRARKASKNGGGQRLAEWHLDVRSVGAEDARYAIAYGPKPMSETEAKREAAMILRRLFHDGGREVRSAYLSRVREDGAVIAQWRRVKGRWIANL
jgi:hypothetical protein